MRPDKAIIRQRFAKAASTYDRQALIQQRVAERLLNLLSGNPGLPPRQALEIGSCTGILTTRLAEKYRELATLYVNDLVPQFEVIIRRKLAGYRKILFLAGDIESMDIPAGLDLVISSSTFHWLADLPGLLHRLRERMTSEATLCFSIYSTENLRELRQITGIGLEYYSLEQLREMIGRDFELLACEEELLTVHFQDPGVLLQHLRETGVNALQDGTWSRGRLREFNHRYEERFGRNQQVPLTYHPVYCLARRP